MIQRGECAGLALKAGQAFGVMCESLGQDLDRDVAAQVGVRGSIDFPHAAHADLGATFIRAESGAGGQCHDAAQGFYWFAAQWRRSVDRSSEPGSQRSGADAITPNGDLVMGVAR